VDNGNSIDRGEKICPRWAIKRKPFQKGEVLKSDQRRGQEREKASPQKRVNGSINKGRYRGIAMGVARQEITQKGE